MQAPLLPGYISSSETDGTSLVQSLGELGVLFDGSTVYSAYAGPQSKPLAADFSNSYTDSAPYLQGYAFDMCAQQSSGTTAGNLHSNVAPPCLLNQLGATTTAPSPLLGFMVDGFPVYGPRGPNGVYMKRCSEPTADKTYCLDKCGGFYDASQTIWKDGYVYRYFMMGPYNGVKEMCSNDMWRSQTMGAFSTCSYTFPSSFFPFSPLCLRGCIPPGLSLANSILPPCSAKTWKAGYTSSSAVLGTRSKLAVYTPPAACVVGACTQSGYANPGECVHDKSTGAYIG